MTKLGILQLPYNLDLLQQLVEQLAKLDGQVFFIDVQARIDACRTENLPYNIEFIVCESYEPNALVALAEDLDLDNLVSFAELGLLPAARVREALSMRGHDADTELYSINKFRMRERLRECGLSQVKSQACTPADLPAALEQFGLPAIVKPSSLTGSIGVQLIQESSDLASYLDRIEQNVYSKGCELVLESFIPGAEYSVEGLLLDGTVHIYGVTEKQTTEAPYFVETGHCIDANHPLLSVLHPALVDIFRALNLRLCPFHIEFKMVGERVEIIEIHSRFGGDFITKLVEYSLGNKVFLEYAEYLLSCVVPRIERHTAKVSAIGFTPVPAGVVRSVSALPETSEIDLLEHKIGVKSGDVIKPQTGYYERPAYFIARLNDRHAVQAFNQWLDTFSIDLEVKEQA